MSDKVIWRELRSTTIEDYESWIMDMRYDPYLYDSVLQSMDWISSLTAAIQKVSPMVGEGAKIEYLYWEKLKNWEFILNCFSIGRALGALKIDGKKLKWNEVLDKVRSWADSIPNSHLTAELFQNGASFLYDMTVFFLMINENWLTPRNWRVKF